jgi:acetyl esterase
LQAKQKKEFDIALLILDYPPLDLLTDPADKPESDKTSIPPQRARDFNLLYVENEANARHILASPVYASKEELSELPETLIYTAGHDNLRFEAEGFANQLIKAGVQVTVRRFQNSGHGFVIGCAGEYNNAIHGMEEAMLKVVHRIEDISANYDAINGDQTFTGEE